MGYAACFSSKRQFFPINTVIIYEHSAVHLPEKETKRDQHLVTETRYIKLLVAIGNIQGDTFWHGQN
jgi:hypothetical protein